jgi:hypothetical protein
MATYSVTATAANHVSGQAYPVNRAEMGNGDGSYFRAGKKWGITPITHTGITEAELAEIEADPLLVDVTSVEE